MEWSDDGNDDDNNEDSDVAALRKQLAALHIRLNNLDERVAETQVEKLDLEDKVEVLRKAMTSKVKRLAKATGNEHLYRAPDQD